MTPDGEHFELKATLPYALRHEGCAKDEMAMRRQAAEQIEWQGDCISRLEADNIKLREALEKILAFDDLSEEHNLGDAQDIARTALGKD